MNANWLITLERKSVVQNDFGEEVETWLPLVSDLFAEKQDVSDGERVAAAEVSAKLWRTSPARVGPGVGGGGASVSPFAAAPAIAILRNCSQRSRTVVAWPYARLTVSQPVEFAKRHCSTPFATSST